MAHLNLIATGKSIELQIDVYDWTSFEVNEQSVQPGGSITVDSCATFTGVYKAGTPAYPWTFMTFINFGLSNSHVWVAVVQFTKVDGGCQVSGNINYANESSNFNINQLVATLQATQPQTSVPFTVNTAGTTTNPAGSQTFSANGLTGSFVANVQSR
ncbi:MAG: hypothetical protein SFY56_14995 [Bacteroidota bacterium]|nr:hypothetical protein [Bacteroidota bacterium]